MSPLVERVAGDVPGVVVYARGRAVIVARRYLVSGRVQGVGFRFFTEDTALREGVSGYVRNLPDGRVEAVVEGDVAAVSRVEQALWNGPPGARVEQVEVEPIVPTGRASSFRVRA
jgi:acylphosphatase